LESNWGREEQIFPATKTVKVIAVSLDGKSVALFAHGANSINVWNVITGELQYTFHIERMEEDVECLMFSEDGIELIAILLPFSYTRNNDDHRLKAWSLVTGKFMTTLTSKQSDLLSLTDIRNWSFLPGKQELYATLKPMFDPIYGVSLSADGTTMSLFCSSFVYIGNTDTKCIRHILDLSMTVRDVQLSATRAAIRTQYLPEDPDSVIVWDLINDKEIDIEDFKKDPVQDVERPRGQIGPHRRLSLSPDGINLAYADETRFEIWDLDSKEVKYSREHQDKITQLTVFPDGSKLMVAGLTPSAQLWDLEQPDDSIAPRSYDANIYRVSLSNDGTKVVLSTRSSSNDPQIWDLVEGRPTLEDLRWRHQTMICDDVIVARLLPEYSEQEENNEQEKQSEQEGLWLWSLARDMDLEIRGTVIPTSSSQVDKFSFAISPDRTSIALIGQYGVLESWGFSQYNRSWSLHWSKGTGIGILQCPCIAFSSDGARVLIWSDFSDWQHTDGCNITVWCFENAHCEFEIHESNEKLNHAILSHDSTMLAMGLSTGVKIYNLPNKNANILLVREGVPWLMAFSPQNTRIAVGWSSGDVSIHNIAADTVEWVFQSQPMLVNVLRFSFDDSWNEEPFYTLDPSGEWILHDNKRVLALPEKFCEKGSNPRLVGRQDYRANTMAFFTRNGRLATFLFDGVPSF
jgi:WD40 repeat protein